MDLLTDLGNAELDDSQNNRRGKDNSASPRTPLSPRGVYGSIALGDLCFEPVMHFLLHPSHPALTEFHPFRELTGRLKAGYVLWRIQNQVSHLPF